MVTESLYGTKAKRSIVVLKLHKEKTGNRMKTRSILGSHLVFGHSLLSDGQNKQKT
jgi:hypothetical protein